MSAYQPQNPIPIASPPTLNTGLNQSNLVESNGVSTGVNASYSVNSVARQHSDVNRGSASYNFDARGNKLNEPSHMDLGRKPSTGGLIKLLVLLLIPIGLTGAVALFFLSNVEKQAYQLENNVVMTIEMKNVNWQDLGAVFEPIVPLKIKTLQGYEEWEFLLDSGAVVSSLPRDWADKMGKDLSLMKRSTFRGFGNAKSFAYQGDMVVKIGDKDKAIPVVFTEAAGTKSLLGRKGFFQDYSVFFNHEDRQIEIRE